MATVFTISLPDYTIETKPDYDTLGREIDRAIEEHFDGELAIRSLSITDHPQLTLDQLAGIILETGTDRYDPNRKALCWEDEKAYLVDLQAGWCTVKDGRIVLAPGERSEGADIIYNFYENAPHDRGYPLRIDLLVIYDRRQLLPAMKVDMNTPDIAPRYARFLFRFRDPGQKQKALLGVIKILR